MNREFVMLSESIELEGLNKLSLGQWYASEKLDGMRAIWLPDTRGIEVGKLPFANLDKDRSKNRGRASSGLWSRYAKPIWAPDWWLDALPRETHLDGELFKGRGEFQGLVSIVKDHSPCHESWKTVKYCVFDAPSPDQIYRDGKIHNTQLKKHFKGVWDWCKRELGYEYRVHNFGFSYVYHSILSRLGNDILGVHHQESLPWRNSEAIELVKVRLEQVLEVGGEGLILRHPSSTWEPRRQKTSLKIKPYHDAEATVVGTTLGEGRLEGMVGALEVEADVEGRGNKRFKIGTGLTDRERQVENSQFVVGTVITYRYRELTSDGVPREARFLRLRSDL